jgi:RNA polymerase sigma-70 factor (ECF subfamily)
MTDAALGGDEAELVDAARAGDRRAFELLLVPLLQPAYRVAFNMLGDRDAADDAVQQAALNAWRGVRRLRPGTPSLRPWFLTIVVNECRSIRRGRWWRVLRVPDIADEPHPVPDLDRGTDLRRALDRLPARQRLLLYLYFCLDLPFEEIGPILRISPAAARARLYRITRGLRQRLQNPDEVRNHGS